MQTKKLIMRFILALTTVTMLCFGNAARSETPQEVYTFVIGPTQSATELAKTWTPVIAPHTGDGNNKVFCKLTVDNAIVDGNGATWMRVRSMGAAELPQASRSGIEGAVSGVDGSRSFRAILRRERFTGDLTAGALRLPQVVRSIEAIAAPPGARFYLQIGRAHV